MLDWLLDIFSGDNGNFDDGFDVEDDLVGDGSLDVDNDEFNTPPLDYDFDSSEISFRGSDEQFYLKKAEHATDQQEWNLERAQKALKNGQETVYKEHVKNADIWAERAKDFLTKAKSASKKDFGN